ncbi:hypothetical protein [Vibrio lentus]|uniref:Uncharacterized protein n=1 Tax=Vibrio lentus TaxID=136468 RepID=A0A2N7BQ83_9VIBR|nr:hypothetical protein [Vibrio lentus]PME48421.1 hypothetical protein BCV34_15790 [Vibrio lentus]PME61011.1 hypothetical protein BCV30_12335 [Vibrio lentus]PME92998.1 hypothetical protein BCV27_21675 [Vibrio lentus]PMH90167.1 hypothetical protein BCU56_18075 [Vibrio lentus]PMI04830.1 hypothetical protein BCU53_16060 [Vibrio lentus]
MKIYTKSTASRILQLGVALGVSSPVQAVNLTWDNHDLNDELFATYHCQSGYDNSRNPEQCLWSEPEATTPQCGRGQTLNAAKTQCITTKPAVKYCAAGGVLQDGNRCKKTVSRGVAKLGYSPGQADVYVEGSNGVPSFRPDLRLYETSSSYRRKFSYGGWDYTYKGGWPGTSNSCYDDYCYDAYKRSKIVVEAALNRCSTGYNLQGTNCIKTVAAKPACKIGFELVDYDGVLKCGLSKRARRSNTVDDALDSLYLSKAGNEDAAFRYLDKLYRIDETTGQFISTRFSFNGDFDFASLFTEEDRDQVSNAIAAFEAAYLVHPEYPILGEYILDAELYEVTVAVMQAQALMDSARMRLVSSTGNVVDELNFNQDAFALLEQAVSQYLDRISLHREDLVAFSPNRDQDVPFAYNPQTGEKTLFSSSQDGFFRGYKDVRFVYGAMEKASQALLRQARFMTAQGYDNTERENLIQTITQWQQDFERQDQELQALFRPGHNEFVNSSTAKQAGLDKDILSAQTAAVRLEQAKVWLRGESSLLNLEDNALFIVNNNTEFDSFDWFLNKLKAPLGAFERLVQSYHAAQQRQTNMSVSADAVAANFNARSEQFQQKLFGLTGWTTKPCPSNQDVCYTSSNIEKGILKPEKGSLLYNQISTIHGAKLNIERMFGEYERKLGAIDIEIDRLVLVSDVIQSKADLIIDYGEKQEQIAVKIAKLQAEAAKKKGKMGAFTSGLTAIVGVATGNPMLVLASVNSMVETTNAASADASMANSIGGLQGLSQRLAAEERAKLTLLDGDISVINSAALIENMWLDINRLEYDIALAQHNAQLEVQRYQGLLNDTLFTLQQQNSFNASLSERYFADPIHSEALSQELLNAEHALLDTQRQLFYATNALEYKWMESFDFEGQRGRDVLFSLTTKQQFEDYLVALEDFDNTQNMGSTSVQQHTDVFSLKRDVMGYEDVFDEYGTERAVYPNPNTEVGGLVTASEAFRYQLSQKRSTRYPSYLDLSFATNKTAGDTLLFRGPEVLEGAKDNNCLVDTGTYMDKIESVAINIKNESGASNKKALPATLYYGGVSLFRTRAVGKVFDQGLAAENEFLNFPVQFWNTLQEPYSYLNSSKTSMMARVDQNIPLTFNSAFQERSVAATNWRLKLAIGSERRPVLDINEIEDIELIFKHRYADRDFPEDCISDDGEWGDDDW